MAAHEDVQRRIQDMALQLKPQKSGTHLSRELGIGRVTVSRGEATNATSPSLTDAVNRLNGGDASADFVLAGVKFSVSLG